MVFANRESWMWGWFPSKNNPQNVCRKVGDHVITVFCKNGVYGAVYNGQFSPKYTLQSEAQEAAFELVTGEPFWLPPQKTIAEVSRAIACQTLELPLNPSEPDIQSAFRRMMKRHHPDLGGDSAQARKIIQARETLISVSN